MNIEDIEGVGKVYGGKLSAAGVGTVEKLLDSGAKRADREKLSHETGISEHRILQWVNRADLYRIKGIGSEYSDLLEASGVDSPLELSHRVPAHLFAKMEEINKARKLVRRTPTLAEVEEWIAEAKRMPKVVEH